MLVELNRNANIMRESVLQFQSIHLSPRNHHLHKYNNFILKVDQKAKNQRVLCWLYIPLNFVSWHKKGVHNRRAIWKSSVSVHPTGPSHISLPTTLQGTVARLSEEGCI